MSFKGRSMKRGAWINLTVIFALLVILAAPLAAMAAAGWGKDVGGCTSVSETQVCKDYQAALLFYGLIGTVSIPLAAIALALYVLGGLILFLVDLVRSQQKGQSGSPFLRGVAFSSLALSGLSWALLALGFSVAGLRAARLNACQGLPADPPASTRSNGALAMSVKLRGRGEPEKSAIFSLSPEGDLLATLSEIYRSGAPLWSPDGRELVFKAQPWGSDAWGLYRVGADGGDPALIIDNALEMTPVAWSADGSRLLIERWVEQSGSPDLELYWLSLDSGALQRLTASPQSDGDAALSPDGSRIAFVSNRDRQNEIYMMNADGTQPRRLTNNPANDIHPAWSPDGKWIVFASNRSSSPNRSDYDLYLMAVDGGNLCPLTQDDGSEWQPAWSPDGKWIAYIALLEGKVYFVRPDGSDLTPLAMPAAVEEALDLDWAAK